MSKQRRLEIANVLLALISVVLAYASYTIFARDRESRTPAQQFADRYNMPLRRPEIVKSLEYAPSSDFATDLVTDTMLNDLVTPVNLNSLSPEARAAWMDAVSLYDEELTSAADLELGAIAARPGWPYHSALLGQLVYAQQAHALSPALVTNYKRWARPLHNAAAAAETDNSLWQSLAAAEIETWPDLGRVHAGNARSVFRHAFEDPEFVTGTFRLAINTIGKENAIRALPDRARPLWAALEECGRIGDIFAAWSIHQRWDAAEWREREADLVQTEKASTRLDVDEARRLCARWSSIHSVWDYDSSEARSQAARLLEVWPAGTEGRWLDDPRSQFVRYFLSGRTVNVKGSSLLRSVESLSGVPLPVLARIHVLAGDISGAEAIAKASDSFGAFEWTPYVLELARYWNSRNDKARARAALAQLPPAAREECDTLLMRHAVEGGEKVAISSDDRPLEVAAGSPVALCVDRPAALVLEISSAAGAIVDYGWDGARTATVLAPPGSRLSRTVASPEMGIRQLTTRAIVPGTAANIVVRKL